MIVPTALQLLLLVAGAAAAVVAPAGCATEGCAAAVKPVCGADGLTYMNECLAACQGVTVTSQGSCAAGTGATTAAVHIPTALFAQAVEGDTAATSGAGLLLPAASISAYQSEGLRMVGMLKRGSFQPSMPVFSQEDVESMNVAAAAAVPGTTMMVNSRGHLYAVPPGAQMRGPAAALHNRMGATDGAAAAPGAAAADEASTDSIAPSEATAPLADHGETSQQAAASSTGSDGELPAGRRLAAAAAAVTGSSGLSRRLQGIIGRDTRQELRSTPRYPLSSAGHLMFTNPDDQQRYQCSGTLVGTYAVLTAAHCVVARSGEVQEDITFTAAETSRNHAGLGAANGVRVYFNSGYLGTGQDWTNWDLGMVILDKPLGVNSVEAFHQELQLLPAAVRQRARVSARGRGGGSRSSSGRHGGGGGGGGGGDWESQEMAIAPGTVGYAASPRLDGTELISAGYPGDKPLGSAWMMTCTVSDSSASGNVLPNSCPIVNGQSGSSMIERRSGGMGGGGTRYYVRGVVSFEVCKSVCSGACCAGKVSYNGMLKITPYFQGFIDSHKNERPSDSDSDFQ